MASFHSKITTRPTPGPPPPTHPPPHAPPRGGDRRRPPSPGPPPGAVVAADEDRAYTEPRERAPRESRGWRERERERDGGRWERGSRDDGDYDHRRPFREERGQQQFHRQTAGGVVGVLPPPSHAAHVVVHEHVVARRTATDDAPPRRREREQGKGGAAARREREQGKGGAARRERERDGRDGAQRGAGERGPPDAEQFQRLLDDPEALRQAAFEAAKKGQPLSSVFEHKATRLKAIEEEYATLKREKQERKLREQRAQDKERWEKKSRAALTELKTRMGDAHDKYLTTLNPPCRERPASGGLHGSSEFLGVALALYKRTENHRERAPREEGGVEFRHGAEEALHLLGDKIGFPELDLAIENTKGTIEARAAAGRMERDRAALSGDGADDDGPAGVLADAGVAPAAPAAPADDADTHSSSSSAPAPAGGAAAADAAHPREECLYWIASRACALVPCLPSCLASPSLVLDTS
eukprot:gene6233-11510_t